MFESVAEKETLSMALSPPKKSFGAEGDESFGIEHTPQLHSPENISLFLDTNSESSHWFNLFGTLIVVLSH